MAAVARVWGGLSLVWNRHDYCQNRGLERPDIKSFQNGARLGHMANGLLIYHAPCHSPG
jgi:hypothetical protein